MTPETVTHDAAEEVSDLRAHGERIERLLDDLRGMVGPPAWARVEELLRLVFDIQGAGLERLLDHAVAAGADLAQLERRAAGDDLLSSLLLLHGLHPLPLHERVERALAAVRERLGLAEGALTVAVVEGDRAAHVRLAFAGCASARPSLSQSIRRAVLDAAPELVTVEIEGEPAQGATKLVTIGPPRDRR